MAAAGTVLTFAPFVDWGKFLPNPAGNVGERVKAQLVNGEVVNVNNFQVNHSDVIIYPRSEDEVLNKEAFRTWQLIRLPVELGGDKKDDKKEEKKDDKKPDPKKKPGGGR